MSNVTKVVLAAAAFALFAAPAVADEFADKLASGYQIVGFSAVGSGDQAFFVIQSGNDVLVCSATQVNFTTGVTYKVQQCTALAPSS